MTDTLIHFPLYIGDTLKRFIEFPTLQERGAWISITCALVQNDGVLVDDDSLYYKCLAFNENDKQVLKQVLSKCFSKGESGWYSEVTLELINNQKILRQKRRISGQAGGKSRKNNQASAIPSAQASASVLLKQSESESESELESELESVKEITVTEEELTQEILGQFDMFWQDFPVNGRNKGSKKDAESKFKIALKKSTFNEIMQGVKHYANYLTSTGQSNQDAFRWLEKERWRDDYTITAKQNANNNDTRIKTAIVRSLTNPAGY